VAKWLEDGKTDNACRALAELQERADGFRNPDDWVTGSGVEELATGLQHLATVYRCTG
jgi:hypothetical protein